MKLRIDGRGAPLHGCLTPPGDKSISHRALILASLAGGRSRITGLLDSADVRATAEACRQLGATVRAEDDSVWVEGTGTAGLKPPSAPLDMGNSGTALRLLAGVLAAQPFASELIGDASLSRRPMRRIVEPLSRMGAHIETAEGGTAPLRITGNPKLKGIEYRPAVASAQIKSCVLLAGLYASGRTCVIEPQLSRDHTERMLPLFGTPVEEPCCVTGGGRLRAADVVVPADISSATFFLVGAAMLEGSDVLLRGVGLTPTRDGILHVLERMGAAVEHRETRRHGTETVADLRVAHAAGLRGIDVPEEWIPSLIDELPAIMALAAVAEGTTRIRGAAELRVKESDRIAVMARGLETLGVTVQEFDDGIDITGGPVTGGTVDGAGDHRCAMSFCMLAQRASGPVTVTGAHHIDTSYPDFVAHVQALGGTVEVLLAEADGHD
ncbi:3-phosphoshikimate 1-carboxyvinyltransferase [Elongatibacter sediminis]|uniref:3-phosphoshikimate 1-carboxyvinyltransferase n=1 Tax=Elongatibacter sediminis TaxID=3119006 RepID=A0AAW9RD91_9GAMM